MQSVMTTTMKNCTNYSLLVCISLLFLNACAGREPFIDTLDHGKTWEEIVPNLPPYPQNDNLLTFDAGSTNVLSFFIDANSISVDKKLRVIRYSLIIRS